MDNDEALTAIMNAPLAQWRVFLHPLQKRLAVGDRSGPVRVLGGAGPENRPGHAPCEMAGRTCHT